MLIGGPKVTAAAGHAWRNSLMLALRASIPVSVPCGATSTTPGTQAVVSRRNRPASSSVFHARASACITSDTVMPPVWWISGGHQCLPNGSDEPSQAGCPPIFMCREEVRRYGRRHGAGRPDGVLRPAPAIAVSSGRSS